MVANETRTAVLDAAQEFLQTRGYHAFSFRDVAERVAIKAASIHHYFPTKADLCRALIARHRGQVAEVLAAIDADASDPRERLEGYVRVFRSTLEAGNRLCLFGMLAADSGTLEPSVCADLRAAFDDQESWVAGVLAAGKRARSLHFRGSARDEAKLILATLEGAMLVARSYADPTRFDAVARRLLKRLSSKTSR